MPENKKATALQIIGLIIGTSIAVTGWLFGALQNANAQTHAVLEKKVSGLEEKVSGIDVNRAADHVMIETILEDVKEIKELLKR